MNSLTTVSEEKLKYNGSGSGLDLRRVGTQKTTIKGFVKSRNLLYILMDTTSKKSQCYSASTVTAMILQSEIQNIFFPLQFFLLDKLSGSKA